MLANFAGYYAGVFPYYAGAMPCTHTDNYASIIATGLHAASRCTQKLDPINSMQVPFTYYLE